MKTLIVLIMSLLFTHIVFGQQELPDSGFTNKAEAKNLTVNGLKEGKWVEYFVNSGNANYPFYQLTYYHLGKPYGIVRNYYSDGIIYYEVPYKDGKRNGLGKEYDYKGAVVREAPYKDDKENGVERYYQNGILRREIIYSNDSAKSTTMYNQYLDDRDERRYPR
jgi:antitoxin component YwqK of YwqJK toxin-antitoxin module